MPSKLEKAMEPMTTQTAKSFGLYVILLLITTLVILNAWFLSYNFKAVTAHERWVNHTHEVMNSLDVLYSSVRSAESSMRGYILARQPEYMEGYNRNKTAVWDRYGALKNLVGDNSNQVNSTQFLETLLRERLLLLDKNIELFNVPRETQIMKESLASGRATMMAISEHIEKMKSEERKLLEMRDADLWESKNNFIWSLILTTALTVMALTLGFLKIRKNNLRNFEEAQEKSLDAWVKTHTSNISRILAAGSSLDATSKEVLSYMATRFNVLSSSFYVAEKNKLKKVASFAQEKGVSSAKEEYSFGESLVGEAFNFGEIKEIKNPPQDYLSINSSLGRSSPYSIFFVPFKFQGIKLGVIELASFEEQGERFKIFLNAVVETLGVGVNASLYKENLQILLDKTQYQAEELQAQQEELRANNEELEQQTRTLENQQQTLNIKNQELESSRQMVEAKALDLEKSSQYKSEFLAKMSHELRTPLNSLLILATLLIENKEKNLTSQQRDFAKSIQNAGNDLLNLINDILDLSKIEARKLSMNAEKFKLTSLFEQMRSSFEPQTLAKDLKFEILYQDNLETTLFETDRMRVEQVLRNFLSNAVKFTERGSICLIAEPSRIKGHIRLVVEDTGIGVTPEKQSIIFEAFEQADSSVSRKYGGTGLGLTISRELAGLLGGNISLESEDKKGSRFILEIPLELESGMIDANTRSAISGGINLSSHSFTVQKNPNSNMAIEKEANKALKHVQKDDKTILIIEDDETFRKSIVEAVKGYNFKSVEVGDGEVALEVLGRFVPSAILLDIKLPGISGLGLLEMIKQMPHLRHIPIHIISALEYQHSALRMGAVGYLSKPVNIEKIHSALSRIENLVSEKVRRLLIVEDDKRQRESIQHLVSGPDIMIEYASTGDEALKKIATNMFDCIILDLNLPDIQGVELLDRLNQLDISLPPIVIYTGQDLSRKEEEILRKYSESIIIKGAKSPERLLDEVNLFLHRMESLLPEDKREMLTQLRSQEKSFEGKKVLIVDDDLRNVFALTSALETRGMDVLIARDGFEALDALDRHPQIDIVLMDIMMPKMDGYETMNRIRLKPELKDLPIIALTAKAMRGDHEKCIQAGANDYLPKPLNLNNLMSVLKVWLVPKGIFS